MFFKKTPFSRDKKIFENLKKRQRTFVKSTINSTAKIFEKLIFNQLSKYLNDHNLLSPHQSGFRPNHCFFHCISCFFGGPDVSVSLAVCGSRCEAVMSQARLPWIGTSASADRLRSRKTLCEAFRSWQPQLMNACTGTPRHLSGS